MVYLVGAGPGDPELITLKGKKLLEQAEVVIYDYLACSELLEYVPGAAELCYVGKKSGEHSASQAEINALIVAKGREGKTVVRLKGGDPYMFGRGGEEAQALADAGIEFEVVPGVTSAIAAAAYAGIPLTDRRYASSVTFATGHEDPLKPESAHNWRAMASGKGTLVFFMGMRNLPAIAQNLIREGLRPDTPAAVIQWGTTPRHRSLLSTIEKLPQEAEQQNLGAPGIIVIGEVARLSKDLGWFEKKPLLGKTVVVTRTHEKTAKTKGRLVDTGCEVIGFPTLSIEPLDAEPVKGAVEKLAAYDWVVFTSANGVALFWEHVRGMGRDARVFGSCRLAAVGPVTAEALAEHGLFSDLVPSTYTGEAVAKALIETGVEGKKVLLAQAKKASPLLYDMLDGAGAVVTRLPLYDTLPCSARQEVVLERLEEGTVDCITFGSSSAVRYFLERIPAETLVKYPLVKFACIGPVTAKTLEEAGLCCHIQPKENTLAGLVEALKEKL